MYTKKLCLPNILFYFAVSCYIFADICFQEAKNTTTTVVFCQ